MAQKDYVYLGALSLTHDEEHIIKYYPDTCVEHVEIDKGPSND